MKKVANLLKAIILSTLLLTSCGKEGLTCSGDSEFCSFIDKEDFTGTSSVINKWLAKQKTNLSENEKLEQLRDWLECKSCVSEAKIDCNSCIYTLPPQSELKIAFMIKGQKVEKCLDVIMDTPLKVRGFHD